MPIIGYSPWNDAANFGQGVGNALSESLLQLPMQRYALAAQQARMQQQQQLGLARLAETASRNQELGQYHQGMLGLGQDKLQQQQQAAQLLNVIRMLGAQNAETRNQIGLMGLMGPKVEGGQVIQPQLGQSNNITGYNISPVQPNPQMSGEQQMQNAINAMRLYGLASTLTNAPSGYLGQVSNLAQQANAPFNQTQQQLQQTNRLGQPATQLGGRTNMMATPDIIQQALHQAGGDKTSARQWLQDQGYTIPQ